jgi:hypothetical protein
MRKELAILFLLAACTPAPRTGAVAPLRTDGHNDLASNQPPSIDAAATATAQHDLKTLDYNSGKDPADPALGRAILAFERDQGLAEDGNLTPALLDRLKTVRAMLAKAPERRDAVYVYGDGTTRADSLALLMPPAKGLSSDAPANFLMPLKPGSQGMYRIGARGKDGNLTPAITVTCHAGRLASADMPLGTTETMTVDCAGRGTPDAPAWRAFYSPALNAVVRLESGTKIVDLMAIRPTTTSWPAAARTGLEWALTHQLDSGMAGPAEWSSTGVTAHFEIKTSAPVTGQQAGLSGKYAVLSCRRFEMTEASARFPGIACQDKAGWFLPGSDTRLASPANAISRGASIMKDARKQARGG